MPEPLSYGRVSGCLAGMICRGLMTRIPFGVYYSLCAKQIVYCEAQECIRGLVWDLETGLFQDRL